MLGEVGIFQEENLGLIAYSWGVYCFTSILGEHSGGETAEYSGSLSCMNHILEEMPAQLAGWPVAPSLLPRHCRLLK